MKRLFIVFSLIWLTAAAAFGQPYCDVRTFSVRNGLTANVISGFAQTDDGLMWFATWNGLSYHDGDHFNTFRNHPGEDVLTTNRIKSCKPSATGSLWCVTSDGHVYLFDTKSCKFININSLITQKIGHEMQVRGVYPLSNGHIYVLNEERTLCVRLDESKANDGYDIKVFSHDKGNLPKGTVKKFVVDNFGQEWAFMVEGAYRFGSNTMCKGDMDFSETLNGKTYFATTDGRVYAIDKANSRPRLISLPNGVNKINDLKTLNPSTLLVATNIGVVTIGDKGCHVVSVQSPAQPTTAAKSIFIDTKKRVWVYTDGEGVVCFDSRTWQHQWLMAKAETAAAQTTSDDNFFHEDQNGTVWLVPRGGTFAYYDEQQRQLVPYKLENPEHRGEYLPIINKSFADANGNLWLTANTSDRDVSLINFGYYHFRFLPVAANQEARSVMIDRQGRLWVGMYDGQVAVFDAQYRLLGYLTRKGTLQPQPTVFVPRVYALCEDVDGSVWIGTKGEGLFSVSLGKQVMQYKHDDRDKYSLSFNDVYDIDVDQRGHLWVATFGGGLNLLSKDIYDRTIFINSNNRLKQYPIKNFQKVRRITHTPRGEIVLSTTAGLVSFSNAFTSPEKLKFFTNVHTQGTDNGLIGTDVLQALVTHDGKIIVATLGGGVQQVEQQSLLTDKLTFRNLDSGTVNGDGMVQSIVEDSRGDIWGVCGSHLLRYKQASNNVLQYVPNSPDGFAEMSEAKPAYTQQTGTVVLCVRGGVIAFQPQHLQNATSKPKIVFTSVQYQGKQTPEPVLRRDVLDVPSDQRNLTVYFSALEYGDRYLLKYAYKIEGIDKEWNYVGANNSVSFNSLPAGRHRLLVRSTNGDGVWVDNATVLNIYAHPSFWETGWAWLLYAVLLCAAVVLVVYIYTLRAKNVMAREMGEMKIKFFTEIGHKLRTPLTLIGGPVSRVLENKKLDDSSRKHLEMVQRNSTNMLELVNKMLKYNGGDDTYISDTNVPLQGIETTVTTEPTTTDKQLRLLIVEDNDDLRSFLVDILSRNYNVLQATNGKVGLETAVRELPDFIITDVMMPVMDGLTMVHQIKRNKNICHIPIIVLSAKASLNDRLQGLKEGVDDYITKPFSAVYLKSRITNIISSRKALQQAFLEQIRPDDQNTYKLESPQIEDSDNEMMKKLMSFLEEHLGDASLKIEECADAVCLGRSAFYSKLKSIVGMTPSDFLHHIRMQRATELISKSNYSFSQIAYTVGFSDPKYFSRSFKKEFGISPTEYREKHANSETSSSADA